MSGYWTMKDRKQIKIKDMTTQHIENSMAMLKRTNISTSGDLVDYEVRCEMMQDMYFELAEELEKREGLGIE